MFCKTLVKDFFEKKFNEQSVENLTPVSKKLTLSKVFDHNLRRRERGREAASVFPKFAPPIRFIGSQCNPKEQNPKKLFGQIQLIFL